MTRPVVIGPAATAGGDANLKTPAEHGRSFARVMRRRWRVAAFALVLTFVVAAALTASRQKQYDATAKILLQPTDAVQSVVSPGSVSSPADAERDVNTYAEMVTVEPVAEAVRARLGLHVPARTLKAKVIVTGQETSNLVSITARDHRPRFAAALATAFATEYQAYRRQAALAQINQALAYAQGNPEVKVAGSAVFVRAHELEAAVASETGGVQIVRAASVPTGPASPKVATNLLAGLLLGLVLAVAAAYLQDALDKRLLDEADIESAFGAPLLGIVPAGHRSEDATRLQSARRRAYTDVAARLNFTGLSDGARTIMIAPTSSAENPRAVGRALTQALGTLGRRVVLIEADVASRPSADDDGESGAGGLTSILTGHSTFSRELTDVFVADPRSSARRGELEGWGVVSYSTLTVGPPVPEPEALLGRQAMHDVVEQAEERGDLVLVVSGPLDEPSVALPLAHLCDATIVVTSARGVKRDAAEEMASMLAGCGARVVGTVLVPTTFASQSATGIARYFARVSTAPQVRRPMASTGASRASGRAMDKQERVNGGRWVAAASSHDDQGG